MRAKYRWLAAFIVTVPIFFLQWIHVCIHISVCVCVCASYAAMQQQRSRFFSVYVWNLFILSVCIHSHLILDSCLYFSTTLLMLMLKHFCWLFVPFEKFHSLIEMFKCIYFFPRLRLKLFERYLMNSMARVSDSFFLVESSVSPDKNAIEARYHWSMACERFKEHTSHRKCMKCHFGR